MVHSKPWVHFLAFIAVIGTDNNMKSGFITYKTGWQMVNTPNILSKDEARQFNFRFDTKKLYVSVEGNTEAFLTVHDDSLHILHYVGIAKGSLSSLDTSDGIAHWTYCVPKGKAKK